MDTLHVLNFGSWSVAVQSYGREDGLGEADSVGGGAWQWISLADSVTNHQKTVDTLVPVSVAVIIQ